MAKAHAAHELSVPSLGADLAAAGRRGHANVSFEEPVEAARILEPEAKGGLLSLGAHLPQANPGILYYLVSSLTRHQGLLQFGGVDCHLQDRSAKIEDQNGFFTIAVDPCAQWLHRYALRMVWPGIWSKGPGRLPLVGSHHFVEKVGHDRRGVHRSKKNFIFTARICANAQDYNHTVIRDLNTPSR